MHAVIDGLGALHDHVVAQGHRVGAAVIDIDRLRAVGDDEALGGLGHDGGSLGGHQSALLGGEELADGEVQTGLVDGQGHGRSAAGELHLAVTGSVEVGLHLELHDSGVGRVGFGLGGLALDVFHTGEHHPVGRRIHEHAVALVGSRDGEFVTGLVGHDGILVYLEEGLHDLDHGHVDELDGAVVSGLGTLDGHDVAHFDAEAGPVVAAGGIHGTVDVHLTGAVVQVPVAIVGVGDGGAGSGGGESLAVGTCKDLGARSLHGLQGALAHDDVLGGLGLAVTDEDVHFLLAAAVDRIGAEGHGRLSGAAGESASLQPGGKLAVDVVLVVILAEHDVLGKAPGLLGVDSQGGAAAAGRNRQVGLVQLYAVQRSGFFLLAGSEEAKGRGEGDE